MSIYFFLIPVSQSEFTKDYLRSEGSAKPIDAVALW